jgi:hypothetical protein
MNHLAVFLLFFFFFYSMFRDGILDINLTKELSLLLLANHSPFYWWILKKTILYSGLQKILRKKKTRVY